MKYGIIVFKETTNIGDDIQSYAAMKQLPRVDYFIERESLNEFISNDNEKVKTIMNGWYMHNRFCFPPSKYIDPLFISCHFSPLNDGMGITKEYMQGYVQEYMKFYEPIGCRDKVTLELLKENNVDTYKSYCLTLTIPKLKNVKKEKKITLVDVSDNIKKKVASEYKNLIKEVTHNLDKSKNEKLSYIERMDNVEKLIYEYQSSELVITTRLHCALPCLAVGTPVLLIYDSKNGDVVNRIEDYISLLDYCSEEEFLQSDLANYLNKKARKDHLKIRDELIKKVQHFINDETSLKKEFTYDMVKYCHYVNKLVSIYRYNINEEKFAINNDLINMKYAKEYWEKEFNLLLEKYEKLRNYSSRSLLVKFRDKIRGDKNEKF